MAVKRAAAVSWLVVICLFVGCGGSSSSSSSTTVATVTVAPQTASVSVNQSKLYSATAADSSGNTVDSVTFTWSSSNATVASIGNDGVALPHAPGTTQITASAPGATSNSATLTVTLPVTSISLSPRTASVAVGDTQQFTATALDANGNPVNSVIFAWACSFGGTASIDSSGLVTGVAPGTVTIVASASGVTSAPATLTVTR